ncbi:NAD(P)-dependent oxidoreductase [Paraburkholderia strydomiana]|uniref:NAD(P)-dependent oxidoreductase n=1 Tax=Paraburkholderia strydomiana TaxID=1245417 RepID=UPI0038BA3D53
MSNVAFIGLGAMGSRMAANLLKAGHDTTVYDLSQDAVKKLQSAGAKTADSPREAADGKEFVFTMVRDDEVSRAVWLDATNGASAGMKNGAIAIECSTITPAWARELHDALGKKGIEMLEAPVSGSTPQAEDATLVFLVGGAEGTLKRVENVLAALGSSTRHAGPTGAGTLAKLVTNTLMGVGLSTIAEMIGMLRRHGVDAKQVLDAVAGTAMWTAHLTNDTKSMLSGDFESKFPIKLLAKDLGYTVTTAGGDSMVPTVSAVHNVFLKAMDEKLGDLNMTAVVKLFANDKRINK